jgi:hypothetical protein
VRKRAAPKRRAQRAQRGEIVPLAPAARVSPSEARPRLLFSDLQRVPTRPISPRRPRFDEERRVDSAARKSRLELLKECVYGVLEDIVGRRVPALALAQQSPTMAEHLLVWEDRWRRWRDGKSSAPIPLCLLRESGLASAIVKEIEKAGNRKITNHDGRLRAAIKEQRERVATAEERWRRAKKRPKGALVTLAKARWGLRAARVKHAALIRELNTRRVIDSKVSGTRILPREYALGPLLNNLFRRGVPDRGIATLLRLVELPHLSERQIKRIRSRS